MKKHTKYKHIQLCIRQPISKMASG